MSEHLSPDYLVLEYKLKLRLAKIIMIVMGAMFIFVLIIFRYLLEFTNDAKFSLGEARGIAETTQFFISSSIQQSVPQTKLQ